MLSIGELHVSFAIKPPLGLANNAALAPSGSLFSQLVKGPMCSSYSIRPTLEDCWFHSIISYNKELLALTSRKVAGHYESSGPRP